MSSGEKQEDTDIVHAAGDASENDKSADAVLRDDEDEESSDEDIESEGEDDEEVDSTADVEDEDVSEEGDSDEEEDEEEDASEEDEEDEAEDEQEEEMDNADMSSGDENSDRCPICLNGLRKQDIGTPESCDHSFCLECIQEWAKNVNTCPVDRQIFRIILARHAGEEKIFKQFPVEDKQQEKEEEEEDPTYCEVCGQSNREDRLLLCDRCDLGYHCDCLDPPLASVPVHEWFCPDCQQERNTDAEPLPSGRQIARTRVSERVRRLIAEARAERAERRRRIAAMIVAQEAQENGEAGPSASVTAVSPARAERKKTTRKRKTTRRKTTRRKTTKKRKTSKKTGKKTKTRRKRKSKGKGKRKVRKTKKSSSSSPALARTAFFRTATSVKGRIADKLGLSKPPAGRSIPMQKLPQSGGRQDGTSRTSVDYNPSSFSLLGSRDELYLFADQEGEERQPANRPAIPAESLLSKSAKSSHRPLSFSPTKKKVVVKEVAPNSLPSQPAAGGFDLLGSIMQNQDMLHKGSRHVTINRDGSLSAINNSRSLPSAASSVRTATLSPGVNTSTQLSSTDEEKCSRSTPASPVSQSQKTPAEQTHSPKLKPSKSAHFSLSCLSPSKPTVQSESDALQCDSSKNLNSHSDLTAGVSKFADTASSDEELQTIDAVDDIPLPVKKENVNNSDGTVTFNKTSSSTSKAKSAFSSLENSFVEGTQTFNAVRTEEETGSNGDTNVHYGVSLVDNCNEDVYNSNRSSSNSTGLDNGAKFRDSFADMPVTELESKASIGSESLSNGTDHNLSSSNSHEIGSRGESDSALTATANDSSRLHSLDVNAGVVLEADAVYSNNARLNAEEDIGNNSIGFSRTTSSLPNLRNFAAVTRDLNNVHDESLSAMKRNFNLLVSTRSNLAGYESGEENDNIDGFTHLPNDREEGEASDSNEEGEVREFEDRQATADEQEEGEIVDEEERDRWALGSNVCEENNEDDSGGLDVNAIHIEEMEIGTFRKRSMSQNEDVNNEGSKKMRIEEDTPDTEAKHGSSNDGETSEEDGNNGGGSFMLSNLLTNIKTSDTDRNLENNEKGEEEEEEGKEREDLTMKPISILDFIGDASAKKFGLPVVDKDLGRVDHNFGQQRGSANFSGGNNFGYRGSRSYTNRRHSHKQRERNDDDVEDGRMEMEAIPQRLFDRRGGSWQEEDRSRQRSGSQDSQGANERSGSHDIRSSKLHHGRKKESGRRRRDDEGRDRPRKSRSPSGSPRRRTEKRKRPGEHEGKNRHSKKGKRSRWNHEDEDQDSNEEENVEKPDEEVKKKNNESRGLSTAQSNGHPPSRAPEIHEHSSGHYQSHQYPSGVASFSYTGTPVPPLTSSYPPAPPPHPPPPPPPHPSYPNTQAHLHVAHPGHAGQPPYSQLQHRLPVQQTVQTRHPQHHQGYQASYYPQPHLASLIQKPPPPPPQPYPHPVYPVCYPSQPHQHAAAIAHPNAHMPAANQPHSGYPPRYPPPVAQPYPPPVPHAAYPPRPVAQSTTTSAVFTSTATPVYPPQHLVSTSSTPAIPRQSFNTVLTLQEPSMPRTAASLNQDSKIVVTNPSPPIPETRKSKGTVRESASSDVKSARTNYPTSPPTAPIKGVTTYDKVDSSILLNEVKKGFRQLVEDAVRSALRGAWRSKKITKEEYKDIFKRAVEKVCTSKETVVNQEKIQSLVNAYVMKAQKARKAMQTSQ